VVDNKLIMNLVRAHKNLVVKILIKGMKMCETPQKSVLF